ncbi:NAD(P)/FAD-dependent oxidoreductase [Hathewaya limosa]|uniref:NAD(P)H-nitrite reductase large subunit n=1 Tax=Hathewaya limosa TaxID=1536 RepID=A0ABU0JPW3_HATLI|nr:FAD-dependent oxidoreductase [Hathewaya limosa]MDQ0479133.1 NAD(P)H-nitrite reductase large subunit [Hathewaya limosa]
MKYVIIGASAAGISAARTLRTVDPNCEIVMISKDKNVYSRCMLHLVIGGERDLESISFIEKDFFENNKINWIKDVQVALINENEKEVVLKNNVKITYDKLLIASGSSATIPPIKNLIEANNVSCLRNIEDAVSISEKCRYGDDVVIIGAGLVGIDAAIGLIHKGVRIHLIEMSDRILPLQLDKKAASKYEELLLKNNVEIITNASVQEAVLDREGAAQGVVLSTGKIIPCKYIVVAAGVKANVDFLSNSSVKVERGIVIDSNCKTTAQDIFAAGDVTNLAPIWPVAIKQGKTAALNMAGIETVHEDNFAFQNSMNFLGLDTVSLGIIQAPDESFITSVCETKNSYKKIIHKNGRIYGALLQGDISYCGVLTHLIKNKINILSKNKNVLDISFADFYGIKDNGEYYFR